MINDINNYSEIHNILIKNNYLIIDTNYGIYKYDNIFKFHSLLKFMMDYIYLIYDINTYDLDYIQKCYYYLYFIDLLFDKFDNKELFLKSALLNILPLFNLILYYYHL